LDLSNSKAFAYVTAKKWPYRLTGSGQLNLELCPLCKDNGWHFFMSAVEDKDGLSHCVKCGESTNLYKLRRFLNDTSETVLVSPQAMAASSGKQDPLPDYEALHKALMAEAEDENVEYTALDHLLDRGFSVAAIESMKLGLTEMFGKKWVTYPYFGGPSGYCFIKYRTLPPAEKDFHGPSGRQAGLYNEKALVKDLDYLLMVEGEADCVSALSNGIEHVVGIPGAALKKAVWVDKIDAIKPKKIYICYDNDSAGVKGAKELASRLDLERCFNVAVPQVEWTDSEGEVRRTKDLGEWFKHGGGTPEKFQALLEDAQPFPVEGVWGTAEVIRELREEIEGRGSLAPRYEFAWPSLNRVAGGMEDGDVVGWIAEGKVGKGNPLWSRIKTPTGWIKMGDIKVGDALASVDGAESVVTGVFPRGDMDLYKVLIQDHLPITAWESCAGVYSLLRFGG
jgi:5S rRNA maturation endonuclease (ribonuclease M5)